MEKNIHNGEFKRKLIRKLNHFCDLKLEVADKDNDTRNNELIEVTIRHPAKANDMSILRIHHTTSNLIIMIGVRTKGEKNIEDCLGLVLKEEEEIKNFRLVAKKQNKTGKIKIYTKDYNPSPIRFLGISYKEKQQELLEKLQKNKKLVPDSNKVTDIGYDYVPISVLTEEDDRSLKRIEEITKNQRNYRYSLTIKGLLLYLLGPSDIHHIKLDKNVSVNTIKIKTSKSAINTRSITTVLSNLSVNYLDEFPFLKYYKDFEKILGKSVMVNIFNDIAIELQNQLDTNNIKFLRYWVTNRYLHAINALARHTRSVTDFLLITKLDNNTKTDTNTHIKLKDYNLQILNMLRNYQERELQQTNEEIKNVERTGLFEPSFIH